jgi:hypothetical protein
VVGRADLDSTHVDVLQPLHSATSAKEDQDVGVSRVQLPDRSSPEELSLMEFETQIHMVLDSATVPPPGAGHDPLRRGIASVSIGTSGPISAAFIILSLHYAHDIV